MPSFQLVSHLLFYIHFNISLQYSKFSPIVKLAHGSALMWPTIGRTCLSSDSFRPFDWWSPSARASRSRCRPPLPRVPVTVFPIGRLAARVHGATLLLSPGETTAGGRVLAEGADVEAQIFNSTITPKMLSEEDTKLCLFCCCQVK